MTIEEQLDRIANLPDNWDSYGSPPISRQILDVIRNMQIDPISGGAVQLTIGNVEVMLYPDGTVEVWDE